MCTPESVRFTSQYIAQCSVYLALCPQHAKLDPHHPAFHFSPNRTGHSSWSYSIAGTHANLLPEFFNTILQLRPAAFLSPACCIHLFVESFRNISSQYCCLFSLTCCPKLLFSGEHLNFWLWAFSHDRHVSFTVHNHSVWISPIKHAPTHTHRHTESDWPSISSITTDVCPVFKPQGVCVCVGQIV